MMKTMKSYFMVIGVLLLLTTTAWASFQAGEDAYLEGDYEAALKEWQPLADQGVAMAQNMLGYMYRYGQGLPQDFGLALQWYHRAAEQGDAKAQNNLGVMYRRGLGTPQDFQEALRLFRRSADQGDGGGQNHLGLMYYKGEGVPRDYVQAYMWASLAANQGLDQALQALPMLENEMTPAQIEEGKRLAKEWSQRKNKVEL